jgi:hypothetical protein
MRAELAAIHVALDIHKHDPWLGIFTDSKTSLHAIQNKMQRPSHTTYHHHKPLITAIVDSLLYRAELVLTSILHKIREHTHTPEATTWRIPLPKESFPTGTTFPNTRNAPSPSADKPNDRHIG